MELFFLIYPLLGLFSGFLAGLLGIGGGLVIVPALLLIFPYQGLPPYLVVHAAIATSLATVVVTSLIATYTHHRHGAVVWPVLWWMAPGLLGGAMIGASIASILPGNILGMFFGLFAIAVAIQMGFHLQPPPRGRLPVASGLTAAGAVIGTISAMVGIGGGTLSVPFLRWSNMTIHGAIATSSACGFPIAVGGSLGFILSDLVLGHRFLISGAIYWPAALWIAAASLVAVPMGARLTHRISSLPLTRIFAFTLAIIGLRLVFV